MISLIDIVLMVTTIVFILLYYKIYFCISLIYLSMIIYKVKYDRNIMRRVTVCSDYFFLYLACSAAACAWPMFYLDCGLCDLL